VILTTKVKEKEVTTNIKGKEGVLNLESILEIEKDIFKESLQELMSAKI